MPIASELASPAPATPSGRPVPHPAMRMGAKTTLSTTVSICTSMPGFTMPVPRKALPMDTSANWSASPGMYQRRYDVPAAIVSAFDPRALI